MSRDPDGQTHRCEKCPAVTDLYYRRDLDEYWCDNCLSNEAEAAYERQQAANLESPPESAREEQLRTWREKQEAQKR